MAKITNNLGLPPRVVQEPRGRARPPPGWWQPTPQFNTPWVATPGVDPRISNQRMVRSGNARPGLRAAKSLLLQRGIEDPQFLLRRKLTDLDLNIARCIKARNDLTHRADAQPLETILTALTGAGVGDALARQICGLDTDASAAEALRRSREDTASKRTRDAAEDSENAGTRAAKVARPDGTHPRRSHRPWPVGAAAPVCSCALGIMLARCR